jgi:hypothetical protein
VSRSDYGDESDSLARIRVGDVMYYDGHIAVVFHVSPALVDVDMEDLDPETDEFEGMFNMVRLVESTADGRTNYVIRDNSLLRYEQLERDWVVVRLRTSP